MILGICGESGAGKSTLCEIILGLLSPNKGTIKSDGQDIKKDYKSWHEKVGYIPQSPVFLDDTIIKNITLEDDKNNLIIDSVYKVLKIVNLKFSKKEIIKYTIGENGKKLSEGQRQRLAIARTLYKGPKLLVLDEITSSLDPYNEKNIIKLLKKINKSITIIFISHKSNSFKFCNKIFKRITFM